MKKTLLRDVKLKDGRTFAKGTVCTVAFTKSEVGTDRLQVSDSQGNSLFKTRSYSAFWKAPSIATMEKWTNDGVAKTVSGHRTEPDGYGPDGSPSWLLALGLI